MCGIFAYAGSRDDAPRLVFEALKTLEYRGYDSWGVAALGDGRIEVEKQIGKIGSSVIDVLPPASLAIGHTRWATHGGVTRANAHPHLNDSGKVAVCHNGIFENYEEHRNELREDGVSFASETDTEVVAHLVGTREGKNIGESVRRVFNDMQGSNAVIVLDTDSESITVAKNGSPLILGFGKDEFVVASDATAILPYTHNVHYMQDGEMARITRDGITLMDAKTGKIIKPNIERVEWSRAEVSRGEYEDFMLKEIYEQPELVERIAQAKKEEYAGLLGALKKTSDVCLLGCGSAAYVALAGTYIFPSLAKKAVSYAVGSEFRATVNTPRGSLVLALSQSGETMDIIESVKAARKNKATVGALVNVPGSTLFRFADEKTLIGAGPEKAVASTKALVGKLSWLFLLADELVRGRNGMRKELVKAARSLRLLLEPTGIARIKALAERIKDARHLYVVGRGISYPASLETALKIKEISYIHAEGMAGGELKHGVIALIEKGTPCIVFAPDDETRAGALAGAMEMKARGGYIIGIGSKPADVFDEFLPVADAGIATVIPHIAAGQLLAYYLTKALGYDADKPRNLAKSVTVK